MSERIDIFISYKREERSLADAVSRALQGRGFTVVTDIDIGAGEHFGAAIDRMIRAAKTVVVLWTPGAASSQWVQDEARLAIELDTYLGVLLEETDLPVDIRYRQCLDLVGEVLGSGGADRIADAVAAQIGEPMVEAEQAKRQTQRLNDELMLFQAVERNASIKAFQAYLRTFPDALLSELAAARLEMLRVDEDEAFEAAKSYDDEGKTAGGRKPSTENAPCHHEVETWRRGDGLFRVPRTMWTETAELAELRLAPSDALPPEARIALMETMVGRGRKTISHPVTRLGSRVKAVLHADPRDIAVSALSSEVQDLIGEEALAWDWRLIPLREGSSRLTLRVTNLADMYGREVTFDTQALHVTVEVTVRSVLTRPRRFVRDNWKWLLGSSGIGAAAAIYGILKA